MPFVFLSTVYNNELLIQEFTTVYSSLTLITLCI